MATATKSRTVPEHKLSKTHTGHAQHMCELVDKRQMDKVASQAKNAKYICNVCGRAAAKASSLCEAVQI